MEELMYTQQLADNDVSVRMKALKKLKNFLQAQSVNGALTYEGCIKIWKGLYYCMYNADKPLVQEDLAESISQLIHELETNDQKQLFFKVALDTYGREWNGSDKFRMDKYLMLFTRTLRQCLFFLLRTGWDITEVKKTCEALESSIICPFDDVNAKPLGLKTFLSSIILEELAKVAKKSLPDNVLLSFMYPFWKVLAVSKQQAFRREIKENTVFALIRQSDLGIAMEADLAADEKVDEEESEVDEGEVNEDESEVNEQENIDKDEDTENFVMDPRAGGVDVYLPQLKPEYREVAKMFQGLGSIPEVTSKNRNQLYFHARQFMNLAEGIYPLRDSIALSRLKTKKKSAMKRKMKTYKELNKRRRKSHTEEKQPEVRVKNYKKRLALLANAEKRLAQKMQETCDKIVCPSIVAEEELAEADVKDGENDSIKANKNKKRKCDVGSELGSSEGATPLDKTRKKLKSKIKGSDASPTLRIIDQGNSPNQVQHVKVLRKKVKTQTNFEKRVKKNKRKFSVESVDGNESNENDVSNVDMVGKKTIKEKTIKKKTIKKKTKIRLSLESVPNAENSDIESKSDLSKKKNNFEKKVKKRKIKPALKSASNNESIEESLKVNASKVQNIFDKTATASSSPLRKKKGSGSPLEKKKKSSSPLEKKKGPSSPMEKRKKKKKVAAKESALEEIESFLSSTNSHIEQDPWKEPLKEGETEIFLPSKKLTKMQKRKMKRNLIIKRTPKINTKGKTLQINLSENKEHELKDYHKVLRKSPGIPFSAHKQPPVSVLKNSDTPTPTRKPFKSKAILLKYNL